ncbi:MAG: hypothetical protein TREMPRED_000284 [Tremellales sp. Tagirdzhanova-0007]|nr:MAG: hypothetical protein TREMPRED_000284 [Tremellales sp. Tagirdzhanova-0007]
MLRRASHADSQNDKKLITSAINTATRPPLTEAKVNVARTMEGGKRKAQDLAARPSKVSRLESVITGQIHRISTPTTTRDTAESIGKSSLSPRQLPKPTPARELLRRILDENEDELTSLGNSISEQTILRPPTPPRLHMRLSSDPDIGSALPAVKRRAVTPDELENEPPTKLSAIKRLDFNRLGVGAASPRRPMGSVGLISRSSAETLRAGLTFEGAENAARVDREKTLNRPPISSSQTSSSDLQAPVHPAVARSPRRVMGQMSRLGRSSLPSSPNITSTSKTSLSAAFRLNVACDITPIQRTSINSGKAEINENIAILPGSSNSHAKQATLPEMARIQKVQEDAVTDMLSRGMPLLADSNAPVGTSFVVTNAASSRSSGAMGPPSRIPVGIKSTRPSAVSMTRATPQTTVDKQEALRSDANAAPTLTFHKPASLTVKTSVLGKGLPSVPATSAATERPTTRQGTTRRKPSYPSSLGSGPLARPSRRAVSNPVRLPPPSSTSSSEEDEIPAGRQSPRSLSYPAGSRLSMGSSLREGLSLETTAKVNGLSEALERLKMKKLEATSSSSISSSLSRPSLAATTSHIELAQSSMTASSSSRLSAVLRPRRSTNVLSGDCSMASDPAEIADRSLAGIRCSTIGEGCLKGVVAFVDVHTEEGADSSGIFEDILRYLGAKVLGRPTESCTHIIYKSGKPTTLSWWRRRQPKPYIVGISWLMKSKEKGVRLREEPFVVDVTEEDRRKSMEPKALALTSSMGSGAISGVSHNSVDRTNLIADARRKSMLYAPQISSPLKKVYQRDLVNDSDEE